MIDEDRYLIHKILLSKSDCCSFKAMLKQFNGAVPKKTEQKTQNI